MKSYMTGINQKILICFFSLFLITVISSNVAGVNTAPETWNDCAPQNQVTINSLPFTLSESNTCYRLESDLYSPTNGILVRGGGSGAENITLFLNGYSIYFGTAGGDNNYGLQFYGNHDTDGYYWLRNVRIVGDNGAIHHLPSDTTADRNMCFQFVGGYNINMENVNARIAGFNGHISKRISGGYSAYNIEIAGGTWTSDVTAYASRCQMDGAIFKGRESGMGEPTFEYNWKIHDITVTNGPGQGFTFGGLSYFYDNNITIDARNDFYTYPSGGTCLGTTNSAALLLSRLAGGSEIRDNVIRAGSNYAGCDLGMLVEISKGTAENPVEIFNNDIELHRGNEAYYGTMNCKGIKTRYHNMHVNIHHNNIKIQIGNTGHSAYGPDGVGLEILSYNDAGSDFGDGREPDSFVVYEYNNIEMQAMGGDFDEARSVRLALSEKNGHNWYNAGNRVQYNRLKSCFDIFWVGGLDNGGRCFDAMLNNNTIEFDETNWGKPKYVYHLGWNGGAERNIARDNLFVGPVADIAANPADLVNTWMSGDAGERDLSLERTLTIKILGNNDSLITDVPVTVTNNYNDEVINSTSGSIGYARDVVKYYREFRYLSDSTNYNPFNISVSKGGLTKDTTIYVNWDTPILELILNTAGTVDTTIPAIDTILPPPAADTSIADTIPPAQVEDLGVLPGTIDGAVVLSWTAVGDDGLSGTADYYLIRYSESAIITESDWDAATVISNLRTPAASGTPETYATLNLPIGHELYFSVRAVDDAGLESDIVSASGFTRGIQTPIVSVESMVIDTLIGEVTFYAETVPSYLNIYYEFVLDTDNSFSNITTVTDSNAVGAFSIVTFTGLQNDQIYYYRVRATADDLSILSAWSPTLAFSMTGGVINQPPSAPLADSPIDDDIITSTTLTLSVLNSTDPESDLLTYDFELYDANSANLIESAIDIAEGDLITYWDVPDNLLQLDSTYTWHARSFDGEAFSNWSPFYSFSIVIVGTGTIAEQIVYPYPNPVSFAQGQTATFTLPDSPSDLLIQTIAGETVVLETGVSGNYFWDGKNESGFEVAMGVYLWYVNGNAFKGKIMVKP